MSGRAVLDMGLTSVGGGTHWKYDEILYVYVQFQGGYGHAGPIPEHVSFIIKNGSTKNGESYALPGSPVIQNPIGYVGVGKGYDDMSSFGALKLEAKTGQSNAKFTALANLTCVYGANKGESYNKGEQLTLASGFYGFAKS